MRKPVNWIARFTVKCKDEYHAFVMQELGYSKYMEYKAWTWECEAFQPSIREDDQVRLELFQKFAHGVIFKTSPVLIKESVKRITDAIPLLGLLEEGKLPLELHACMTGDCSHQYKVECREQLSREYPGEYRDD